jgi:protein CpxP
MNEIKRIRLWQGTVGLLVLCNTALLLTIWLKPHSDGAGRGPGETPRDFVVRALKFTEEQTRQYDILVSEHQQAMRRLRQEAMGYRQLLFTNLKNQNADHTHFADSLAGMIANNQKEIEMVTYNHFAQVRALCTGPQKPEFDQVIGDVIKKMNGGPPHRPDGMQPPPDGHMPPPGNGAAPPNDGDVNRPPDGR